MKLVVWTDGGFGMAAHNYDGDVLTDELAQVHMSPGFITSNLVGVDERHVCTLIKEFEASHGTVTDMDEARLRGEETSLNPLGMVEGLIGAMNHAADVHGGADRAERFHRQRSKRHSQALPGGTGHPRPVRGGRTHHRAVHRRRRGGDRQVSAHARSARSRSRGSREGDCVQPNHVAKLNHL